MGADMTPPPSAMSERERLCADIDAKLVFLPADWPLYQLLTRCRDELKATPPRGDGAGWDRWRKISDTVWHWQQGGIDAESAMVTIRDTVAAKL